MNKLKLWLGILLIFVLGALAGSLVTGILVKNRIIHFREGKPGERRAHFVDKLTRELNLTQNQRVKIEEIIKQTHEELRALGEKYHPEFEKIREESFELMKKELNEEQKQKLDELRKKFRKRFKKDHRRPPPPPGEGPPPPPPGEEPPPPPLP